MNGVVFQTSVTMMTISDEPRLFSGGDVRFQKPPMFGETANWKANAETTVMMPYGSRMAVRTVLRPKMARCMNSASPIPRTSSMITDTATMMNVLAMTSQNFVEVRILP